MVPGAGQLRRARLKNTKVPNAIIEGSGYKAGSARERLEMDYRDAVKDGSRLSRMVAYGAGGGGATVLSPVPL